MAIETPVVIAGGGPVGLSAAILLARAGVRCLLVERHPTTSLHPKARGINARTMEVFRSCGVEDAVRAAGLPPSMYRYIIWAESLAGRELERREYGKTSAQAAAISPSGHCLCSQDALEPVLRAAAESEPLADVRFHVELRGFSQDADGVTATIHDRATGSDETVRAAYLIAADGARSAVRTALGIEMHGRGVLYHGINVLAHADLRPWVADRPSALYFIEDPQVRGTFATVNGSDRWAFLGRYDPAKGERFEDFTPERCIAIIRRGAGVPDLDVEVIGVASWLAAARVAERYADGRVFLAGDAAHEMPPTGGFGMNTGIQDAHNLAWKLAAVLHGWAAPALLASYDQERRPVGVAITEQSYQNSASMGRIKGETATATHARQEYLNEMGMIFGSRYEAGALLPDGSPPEQAGNPVTQYVPSARPGGRAPHVWLERDGDRISAIDLFGRGFVLLTGAEGGAWAEAATAAAGRAGVPLAVHAIGRDLRDPDGRWGATYGVRPDGAVLVRPDGYVAWRSAGAAADAAGEVARALAAATGRAAAVAV
jgi:putative polyketide hydroxylase